MEKTNKPLHEKLFSYSPEYLYTILRTLDNIIAATPQVEACTDQLPSDAPENQRAESAPRQGYWYYLQVKSRDRRRAGVCTEMVADMNNQHHTDTEGENDEAHCRVNLLSESDLEPAVQRNCLLNTLPLERKHDEVLEIKTVFKV